ncbi:MAG TPA: toll/interleukin-1 receptor domain-containing protein [Candidatus Bathyarchaeia archaeon]|nr:toll/interleukin-1 receptor domain-containing protein [Candidatus Bathyarchaeia archaeon]
MANPEHLAILKQGVGNWNKWRHDHSDVKPDLSRSNLQEASLRGANLTRADLAGANLAVADLTAAQLMSASLNQADLTGADLTWANLFGANFGDANLQGTNLLGTVIAGTYLAGADFTEADMWQASLADLDLSAVKGLESVHHLGRSTIGIDTIYASQGKIPEVFLRGCGVPEEFITYIGSMVGRPIEYYSCFISYSTKDQAFADRLYADLQAKGVRCWFAPHDMKPARKIHEQIDEAIRMHDKLLLILSEHSMTSNWVGTEIANACERESRENKQMLFPITLVPFEKLKQWKLFDAERGKDSAREIREYYVPDFSGWGSDHAGYQREFEKLVAALKAGASGG